MLLWQLTLAGLALDHHQALCCQPVLTRPPAGLVGQHQLGGQHAELAGCETCHTADPEGC